MEDNYNHTLLIDSVDDEVKEDRRPVAEAGQVEEGGEPVGDMSQAVPHLSQAPRSGSKGPSTISSPTTSTL